MTHATNPERIEHLANNLKETLSASIRGIQDLNQRTHVLAINARIEAARAGLTGRGFRVVADAFSALNLEIQEISNRITIESSETLEELLGISRELAGVVRGQHLVQVADSIMDVVDRNLYERSCDVRWWATDAAVIACLTGALPVDAVSRRLATILESYTVYADIVIANAKGLIVANGRPETYHINGRDVSQAPWFLEASHKTPTEFGFQSAHCGELGGGQAVLVYSCPVRETGNPHGPVLGVLGVVFRWEGLGRVVLDRAASTMEVPAELFILESNGRVLAQQGTSEFGGTCTITKAMDIISQAGSSFVVDQAQDHRALVAKGSSKGFETYASGWSCVIQQKL